MIKKIANNKLYTRIKYNKTLFNGALFSGFSFLNRGLSFILLLILANYILPDEYGYLNLFNTVQMVIAYFIAMSMEGYLGVSYFKEGNIGLKNTFSSIFYMTLIVSSVLIIIILLFGDHLSKLLSLSVLSLIIAVLVSFFNVYNNMVLDYYRIHEKVKIYGVFSCGFALLNFAISILFVRQLLLGWEGRIYAELLCLFLSGGIGFYVFVKNGFLTRINFSYCKMVLCWSIPLIPHLATNFIKQGCDRYIINDFHSISEVGLFSFALNLSNIVTMIGFGFNQSISVNIFKTCSNNVISNVEKMLQLSHQRKVLLILYPLITAFVVGLVYIFIPILLPKYSDSLQYFPLLGIYGLLVCYYLIYTNYLFYYKKTKELMYVTFGSAILHLVLSLTFTRYSLVFTCLIYCITQLIVVLCIRHIALKSIKENLLDNESTFTH